MNKTKPKIVHNGKDIELERKNFTQNISTFLVFDVETIPDVDMVALVGSDKDKETLECIANENQGRENTPTQKAFLQPHYHHIIAISTMIIKPQPNAQNHEQQFTMDLVSVHGPEEALVKHFWQRFRDAMIYRKYEEQTTKKIVHIKAFPCLISFNGKNFDMPAIAARTMKHLHTLTELDRTRIALYYDNFDKWENSMTNYRHKYTKYHVDLCWEMTGAAISLAAACHLAGIPAKTGMNGKDVWKAYQEERQHEIVAYCTEDVLATAQLFSVWNEIFLGSRYNFPTKDELSNLQPKIVALP